MIEVGATIPLHSHVSSEVHLLESYTAQYESPEYRDVTGWRSCWEWSRTTSWTERPTKPGSSVDSVTYCYHTAEAESTQFLAGLFTNPCCEGLRKCLDYVAAPIGLQW